MFFRNKTWIDNSLITCLGDVTILTMGKIVNHIQPPLAMSLTSRKRCHINCRMLKAFAFLLPLDFWKSVQNLVCNRFFSRKRYYWPLTNLNWPYAPRPDADERAETTSPLLPPPLHLSLNSSKAKADVATNLCIITHSLNAHHDQMNFSRSWLVVRKWRQCEIMLYRFRSKIRVRENHHQQYSF